jgi:hypothetical protein
MAVKNVTGLTALPVATTLEILTPVDMIAAKPALPV